MQILILDDDADQSLALSRALIARGFVVAAFDTIAAAEAAFRMGSPSLLILAERVGGKLSHSLALLAGCRAPAVPVIFLTDRQGDAARELFDLIPSAMSLAGYGTLPETVAELAASALKGAQVNGEGLGVNVVPVAVPVRVPEVAPAVLSRTERAAALARLPAPRRALALA